MKTMRRSAVAALVGCLFAVPSTATAQVSPEAAEILRKAAKAAASLKSIGYAAKTAPGAASQSSILAVDATVIAVRGSSESRHKVHITGLSKPPALPAGSGFVYSCDGATVYWIDHSGKYFTTLPVERARALERNLAFPRYFFSEAAYDALLNADRATMEPPQQVGQTLCDVVSVTQSPPIQMTTKFYFGRQDGVLRRYERKSPPVGAGPIEDIVFSVSSIQINPTIPDEAFVLKPPTGFREIAAPPYLVQNPAMPETSTNGKHVKNTATGPLAPDWTLKSMDGRDVRLADLRGHVVLLDFWATWCGPCRMAMPGVQRLHNKFAGKPVSVFGVNCMERGGTERAVQFIKDKGYTYPQLLDNGFVANAYGVRGIPTFVVIGPDGRIVYSGSGYSQQQEEKIESMIEAAIPR